MKHIKLLSTFFIFTSLFMASSLNVCAYELPSEINVGIHSLGRQTSFKVLNTEITFDGDDFYSSKGFTIESDGDYITIINASEDEEIGDFKKETSIISPIDGELLKLNNRTYRGDVYFVSDGNGIIAVNQLNSIEEYLYSVVPSEMPSSWDIEAVKAQAVAARTYTLTRMGVHNSSGYDLCDSIHCQVYSGTSTETANATKAVDKTEGIIATYNGKPIEALYSASSGGHTDDSENVWSNTVPYLRGVKEINEIDATKWTREFSKSQIQKLVESSGDDIGSIENMLITSTSNGGRVQELKIVGSKGTKTLTKDSIRSFFSPAGGSLMSRMFTISYDSGNIAYNDSTTYTAGYVIGSDSNSDKTKKLNEKKLIKKIDFTKNDSDDKDSDKDSNKETDDDSKRPPTTNQPIGDFNKFILTGYGNGHGVGMSQRGAYGMAKLGYTYDEILKHYYTGIELE